MAKSKVLSVTNQKGGVEKSITVYNVEAGLALDGKKVLALDVDPQGDLIKMLGQRKPHDLSLTLVNSMNDVVAGTLAHNHPEIMHHPEGFDFVPGSRSLSAEEQKLVQNFAPQKKLADVGQCFAQLIPFAIIRTKEMIAHAKTISRRIQKTGHYSLRCRCPTCSNQRKVPHIPQYPLPMAQGVPTGRGSGHYKRLPDPLPAVQTSGSYSTDYSAFQYH